MNANITVLKDESLGEVEREYREVKRKAAVGERIKIVDEDCGYKVGRIFTVTDDDFDWGGVGRHRDGTGVEVDGDVPLFHERYLALEPTDIIRINSERLRLVDRKAAVGERVIALNGCDRFYRAGDVGRMTSYGVADFNGNEYVYGDGIWAIDVYRVLEPLETEPLSAKPAPDQAAEIIAKLTTRVSTLESQVQSLAVQLRVVREDCVLIEEGVSEDIRKLFERVEALEKSPHSAPIPRKSITGAEVTADLAKRAKEARQRKRDDIVKRAKEDVKDLLGKPTPYTHELVALDGTCIEYHPNIHNVEFVVNRDKRTVVALISLRKTGKLRLRGIAKCAAGDVFNVWIGRAIALRRALGLEIPEEYVSAPNPTEIRVGDYVYNSAKTKRMLIVTSENLRFGQFLTKGYAEELKLAVIDDSREDNAEPRKEVA